MTVQFQKHRESRKSSPLISVSERMTAKQCPRKSGAKYRNRTLPTEID